MKFSFGVLSEGACLEKPVSLATTVPLGLTSETVSCRKSLNVENGSECHFASKRKCPSPMVRLALEHEVDWPKLKQPFSTRSVDTVCASRLILPSLSFNFIAALGRTKLKVTVPDTLSCGRRP